MPWSAPSTPGSGARQVDTVHAFYKQKLVIEVFFLSLGTKVVYEPTVLCQELHFFKKLATCL